MDNSKPSSFGLTSMEEPSKEMLSAIMGEAVNKAASNGERAKKEYFDSLLEQAKSISPLIRDFTLEESSSDRPFLIVIAGPNGSGKTTFTSEMLEHKWLEEAEYINPDNVAQWMFGDWNSQEAILKAARYCVHKRKECLANHKNLIMETVLSTYRNVDFIRQAVSEGYFVRLFFISTASPTINAARVASRLMQGGHDVPIAKIVSRYPKSVLNCRLLSRFVDRLYVYDNSVDGEQPKEIFRGVEGELLIRSQDQDFPLWAKALF